MCCCNSSSSTCGCSCGSSCGCGCSCGGTGSSCGCEDGGVTTLPSFPDLTETGARFPVYVSYPAFLTDVSGQGWSCGCNS